MIRRTSLNRRQTPLKRTPVRKRRSKPRRGRVLDKPYKSFIAALPCIVCLKNGARYHMAGGDIVEGFAQMTPTEVADVGHRGLSQKCSDRETTPICVYHHRIGPESHHHLGKRFWEFHGLDRDMIISDLNARYESERA